MASAAQEALKSSAFAVEVQGLRRSFDGRPVIDGIDLALNPGEFVALLGRSGSGKSTLLRILAGFDDDYLGTVRIAERRSIVFQEPRLLPWARVLDNVLLGLPSRARTRAHVALSEVGLEERRNVWPATLSGGEAQRVALARALVREPNVLMLDEPFGALDALTRLKMHALVERLCQVHNPAVLLVTHDVDEALALADRVLVLKDGRFSLDQPIHLPRPRDRGQRAFAVLRKTLLSELGVADCEPLRRQSDANGERPLFPAGPSGSSP